MALHTLRPSCSKRLPCDQRQQALCLADAASPALGSRARAPALAKLECMMIMQARHARIDYTSLVATGYKASYRMPHSPHTVTSLGPLLQPVPSLGVLSVVHMGVDDLAMRMKPFSP